MSLQGCVGFLSGSDGKESACHAADSGSIPELGRSPGEGNGYPLQYFWIYFGIVNKIFSTLGGRGASVVAQVVKNVPTVQETWI